MENKRDLDSKIPQLTHKMWSYWGAARNNDEELKEILRKEFFEIFDDLKGPDENFHLVQEIRAKIVRNMDSNNENTIEAAGYTSWLLVYGYK